MCIWPCKDWEPETVISFVFSHCDPKWVDGFQALLSKRFKTNAFEYRHINRKIDLRSIKSEYERMYGKTLHDAVKTEVSGNYQVGNSALTNRVSLTLYLIYIWSLNVRKSFWLWLAKTVEPTTKHDFDQAEVKIIRRETFPTSISIHQLSSI